MLFDSTPLALLGSLSSPSLVERFLLGPLALQRRLLCLPLLCHFSPLLREDLCPSLLLRVQLWPHHIHWCLGRGLAWRLGRASTMTLVAFPGGTIPFLCPMYVLDFTE